MPENLALYTNLIDHLPRREVEALLPGVKPMADVTERGLTYTWRWDQFEVLCSELPQSEMMEHLAGFGEHIRRVSKAGARSHALLARLESTRLVIGVELRPERDPDGGCEELLGKLCGGLRPIVIFESAIYDHMMRLLLGPDGSFHENASGA
jgi:hypothetical protein